jgi:hypothetical protein
VTHLLNAILGDIKIAASLVGGVSDNPKFVSHILDYSSDTCVGRFFRKDAGLASASGGHDV